MTPNDAWWRLMMLGFWCFEFALQMNGQTDGPTMLTLESLLDWKISENNKKDHFHFIISCSEGFLKNQNWAKSQFWPPTCISLKWAGLKAHKNLDPRYSSILMESTFLWILKFLPISETCKLWVIFFMICMLCSHFYEKYFGTASHDIQKCLFNFPDLWFS